MNKIYNNLSIENLTKTEWFNLFDPHQQHEILKGVKDNLDVSVYATPVYHWTQMDQIRLGMKDNLDISKIAKKNYNWEKMERIRYNMLYR